MISLRFEPPVGNAAWDKWAAKAAQETELLRAAGGGRKIKDRLYKGAREMLLAAAHRKCAYCELFLPPGNRQGDVEHYRPKRQVRDGDGKIVKITQDGAEVNHPGYYWLAYDYRNLLPACDPCNQRATDRPSKTLTGKADIFPTLDGHWAGCPEEVPSEKPSLLNPWLPEDDPAKHLEFDPETGLVAGKTERGTATIALLGLNREGLPEKRKDAARYTCQDFLHALGEAGNEADIAKLAEVRDGSAEYAAVRRAELVRRSKEYEERRRRAYEAARLGSN